MPSSSPSPSSLFSFTISFSSNRLVLVLLAIVISFLLSSSSSFVTATFVSTNFAAVSSTGAEWETWISKYHDWRCLYVYSTGGKPTNLFLPSFFLLFPYFLSFHKVAFRLLTNIGWPDSRLFILTLVSSTLTGP
jgi:hypothetical protein